MIRCQVDPVYLRHLQHRYLGDSGDNFQTAWTQLQGEVWTVADLEKITVFELLEEYHRHAVEVFRKHCPELLERRKESLEETGRLYGYSGFASSLEAASDSLSPCGVFP